MWMKLIAPFSFAVAMLVSLIKPLGILLDLAASLIAASLYLAWGIRRSSRLGIHALNEAPNAFRLWAAILGGLLAGSGIKGVEVFSIVTGMLLLALSLLLNDEDMRRWYRLLFPKGGFMLVLLGIDGSGKSTHMKRILELYRRLGLDVAGQHYHVYLFVDKLSRVSSGKGGKPLNIERYYFAYGGSARRVLRLIRAMLSLLDNMLLYLLVIKPKLMRGKVVVSHRFMWSTYIKYKALGYPVGWLRKPWFLLKPHYALVFDIPGAVSHRRILERREHIRYPPRILEEERMEYLDIARRYGYPVISTNGRSVEETWREVKRHALLVLLKYGGPRGLKADRIPNLAG